MAGIFVGLIVGAILWFCGFLVGAERGWEMVHEGKVICQTTLDGKSYCVRKSEVKP